MKRYVCTIIAVICSIFAIASNTLTLSSVSGTPQTEVEVVVSLDNNDAITALEMVLPLGEHLSSGQLIFGSSAFSKTSLNIWKFTVHVLLKPGLENFEHYFASV